MDRFSDLPEHIIHHVMSFLPTKDAVRTSVLSKRFRSTWNSFPIIDFNQTCVSSFLRRRDGNVKERFLNFLSDSLRRRAPNTLLKKFRLHAFVPNTKSDNRIDEAINYALEHEVKELDLEIQARKINGKFTYKLPLILLPVKSVTLFKLKGFNLENLDLTKFSSIEEFRLEDCDGLKSLKISNPQLQNLKINSCSGLFQIDIEESNLKTFSFKGKNSNRNDQELKINMVGAKSVYNLELWRPSIGSKWFEDYASELLLLENLKLKGCNTLTNICIPSPSLKALEICECNVLEEIEILAPKLESFAYKGGSRRAAELLISDCKFLKNLELDYANVTDQWVGNNVPELEFLENLILSHCNMLERIIISHEQLKSFQLIRCLRLEEAVIDGRNLVLFRYNGRLIRSLLSIDSPGLEAELILQINQGTLTNADWYKGLRDFLGYFDHCKLLTINCTNMDVKYLIFPEYQRENLLPPLFDIKHLKVKVHKLPQDVLKLVKSLLWLSPLLEAISIISNSEEKTIKFEYAKAKTMLAMEDMAMNLSCCQGRIIKCWRHCLSKVSMAKFDNSENERLMEFFRREAVKLKTIVTAQTPSSISK
ncbi:F-box domain containing protein [Melia azedarach]|uniref:F-box domain containing protein n=1 Tax=Melia azedarach TaxID=155640 RepID=A0ACC1Z1N6_MELAZ|nr:F-box domain containing protein [Melia azedarach]